MKIFKTRLSFTLKLVLSAASFLSGWACDKLPDALLLCLGGQVLLITTFLLTGPASYLPLQPSLPLTLAGLVIQGAGSAVVIVTTYTTCLKARTFSHLGKSRTR